MLKAAPAPTQGLGLAVRRNRPEPILWQEVVWKGFCRCIAAGSAELDVRRTSRGLH